MRASLGLQVKRMLDRLASLARNSLVYYCLAERNRLYAAFIFYDWLLCMKSIYKIPSIIEVYHNADINYILLKWESFTITLENIKKMHASILQYAVNHDCSVYVADTSTTKNTLNKEITTWWQSEWIDTLKRSGLKLIITLLPENIETQLSTVQWQKGEYGDIRMMNVLVIEQAEYIIREYNKTEKRKGKFV